MREIRSEKCNCSLFLTPCLRLRMGLQPPSHRLRIAKSNRLSRLMQDATGLLAWLDVKLNVRSILREPEKNLPGCNWFHPGLSASCGEIFLRFVVWPKSRVLQSR